MKHFKLLAREQKEKKKKRFDNYYPNISMGTIFMNKESSQRNDSHKCLLNLLQRLEFTSWNTHVALKELVYLLHLEKHNS